MLYVVLVVFAALRLISVPLAAGDLVLPTWMVASMGDPQDGHVLSGESQTEMDIFWDYLDVGKPHLSHKHNTSAVC